MCGLTYGALGVKRAWKDNINSIDFETEFLHKDEFNEKFDFKNAKFPSAYILNSNSLTLLISDKEMNNLKDLDELINLVDKKLAEKV